MSRFLSISFLALYLVANSFALVSMHFCCGHLVDFEWNGHAQKCGSSKDGHKKCCTDFEVSFNNTDAHQFPSIVSLHFSEYNLILDFVPLEVQSCTFLPQTFEVKQVNHAPPDSDLSLIYLMNQAFRL